MTGRIRVLAVAVCRHGDRVLVERGYDRVRRHAYFRAIGGGVEFGERAAEAVVREWEEEFGLALESPALLGVIENLFTYEGKPGHEVVFVFEARLADRAVYVRDAFESTEPDGLRHEAVWVPLDDLARGPTPLYPDGVADLLSRKP